jgi:hypothetical protein
MGDATADPVAGRQGGSKGGWATEEYDSKMPAPTSQLSVMMDTIGALIRRL